MKIIVYDRIQAKNDLPRRLKADSKIRGGKCLIIAGSKGKWGAAILCALASARVGAGYTSILDPKKKFKTLSFPDFLLSFSMKEFSIFDAVAIGPGLKSQRAIKKHIDKLILLKKTSVVLDAEALNTLAFSKKMIRIPPSWILTPHEGEMARLLKIESASVKTDREAALIALQKKYSCVVLLKGSPTLITDGQAIYKIRSGNSALAKAGTGDVLTGLIVGLLSQKLSPIQASCLAAYLHGCVADDWVKQGLDHLSLLASDLVDRLPQTIFNLRSSAK